MNRFHYQKSVRGYDLRLCLPQNAAAHKDRGACAQAPREGSLQKAPAAQLGLDQVQQLFGRGGDGMEVAVVGEDLQGVVPALFQTLHEIGGVLGVLDQQVRPDGAVEVVLHRHIQDAPAQVDDGHKFLHDPVGGVADKEDPLGLLRPDSVGAQRVAFVGGQDGQVFRPHQGDVLDDDLAAHMERPGQGRARQGLPGLEQHLFDPFSAGFSVHGHSSSFTYSFCTILRAKSQIPGKYLDNREGKSIMVAFTDKTPVQTERRLYMKEFLLRQLDLHRLL